MSRKNKKVTDQNVADQSLEKPFRPFGQWLAVIDTYEMYGANHETLMLRSLYMYGKDATSISDNCFKFKQHSIFKCMSFIYNCRKAQRICFCGV